MESDGMLLEKISPHCYAGGQIFEREVKVRGSQYFRSWKKELAYLLFKRQGKIYSTNIKRDDNKLT